MDSATYLSMLERHGKQIYLDYAPFRVNVPFNSSGPWTIKEFNTEIGLTYLRLARNNRAPGLGRFTALIHEKRGIVMSDTCAEIDDLNPYLYHLRGDVLVSGLGLGMVIHILTKVKKYSEHLKSLTILEKDHNVIKLVGSHYSESDKRITIIEADALTWTPPRGRTYDAAWHDIWDDICGDNRPQMTAIRRHFQRKVAKGKQFCWGEASIYARKGIAFK